MTLVDVKLTQGSYWKGAQLPYWVYMVVVVLIGGLGLDHLLLRSPMTFLMKLLIPTLGFWYLYDIAQVFGEREFVEKYGLGVPWYGPIGLGAGIFINKDASNLSPPTIPKPWIFLAYAVLSIFFFIIPLNKVLIGDYAGCLAQISMYTILALFSLGITAILAICWGIYDAYRIIFDTKGLFEKGAARVFPATWVIDPYFNKGALGPDMAPIKPVDPNTGIINKIKSLFTDAVNYIIGFYTFGPRMAIGAATSAAKLATDTASSTLHTVTDTATSAVSGVKDNIIQKGKNTADAINSATGGLASKVIDKAKEKVGGIGGKVVNLVEAKANEIEKRVDDSIEKAVDKGVGSIVNRITDIPNKAATTVDALGKVATIHTDAALAAVQTATAATDIAKAGPKVLGKVADKLTDPAVQDAAVSSVIDNYLPAAASGIMSQFIPTAPVPAAAPATAVVTAAAPAAGPAAPAVAPALQKGGALLSASSSDPAFSSAVLIFSVALLAFGGYVMYSFRKAADLNRNDRPDDSPPDAEPVRGSPKAKRA